MNLTTLIASVKNRAHVDFDDDDSDIELSLSAAVLDVLSAAEVEIPDDITTLSDDLTFAIVDQAVMLYDSRGPDIERPLGLSMAASRIVARYRGVSAGASE